MRRAVPAMFLGAAVIVLGLFTIFLCASNRTRGEELDVLHRGIENLRVQNARSRAATQGHEPGFAVHDEDEREIRN